MLITVNKKQSISSNSH